MKLNFLLETQVIPHSVLSSIQNQIIAITNFAGDNVLPAAVGFLIGITSFYCVKIQLSSHRF